MVSEEEKILFVERKLDGSSLEYDEKIDGELSWVEPGMWRGIKSELYFWQDEAFQLSAPHLTIEEARRTLSMYCLYLNGNIPEKQL